MYRDTLVHNEMNRPMQVSSFCELRFWRSYILNKIYALVILITNKENILSSVLFFFFERLLGRVFFFPVWFDLSSLSFFYFTIHENKIVAANDVDWLKGLLSLSLSLTFFSSLLPYLLLLLSLVHTLRVCCAWKCMHGNHLKVLCLPLIRDIRTAQNAVFLRNFEHTN